MQKTYPNDRTATGKTDKSEALDRLARQNPGGSIEIRPTDRERFHQAYVELGIVAFLTVIHVANRVQGVNSGGSLRGFSRDALLLRLLALFWAVALANRWTALRFTVRLNAHGMSVFNGFWRKTVRWDEAFLAEWRTKTISDGEGGSHTAWRLEIRDAAGKVKMRLPAKDMEPYRPLIGDLINTGLRNRPTAPVAPPKNAPSANEKKR